jgi:hypothetical protein
MLSWGRCILVHTELGWTAIHVLLGSLRKDVSLDLLWVVVVRVLA